jgi:hypothetical protein
MDNSDEKPVFPLHEQLHVELRHDGCCFVKHFAGGRLVEADFINVHLLF